MLTISTKRGQKQGFLQVELVKILQFKRSYSGFGQDQLYCEFLFFTYHFQADRVADPEIVA